MTGIICLRVRYSPAALLPLLFTTCACASESMDLLRIIANNRKTVWSDYRRVDGIMHAFQPVNTDISIATWLAKTKVTDIKVNPEFDPVIFTMPFAAIHQAQ